MCEQSTGPEGLFQIQVCSRANNRRDTKDESCGVVGDLSICLEGERAGGYRPFNRGAGLLGSEFGCAPPVSTCELPSSFGGMIVSKVSSATLQHFAKDSTLRLEGRVKKWQRVPARGKF